MTIDNEEGLAGSATFGGSIRAEDAAHRRATTRSMQRPLQPEEQMQVQLIKDTGQTLINLIHSVRKSNDIMVLVGHDGRREMDIATQRAKEAVMWAVKGITG